MIRKLIPDTTNMPTEAELAKFRLWFADNGFFSFEYNSGYTAAIMDIISILEKEGFENSCKANSVPRNFKTLRAALRYLLQHRTALREDPSLTLNCLGYSMDSSGEDANRTRLNKRSLKFLLFR